MIKPNLEYEDKYSGIIAGVDEAGRGPLVGPVFAAAVIIDRCNIIDGIVDSKKISAVKRIGLYNQITSSYNYAIASASVDEIDQYNILGATKLAMKRAILNLNSSLALDYVLVDGNQAPEINDIPIVTIVKGDTYSLSIAAASILAKVARDQVMWSLHNEFPIYNWKENKGYGTAEHKKAIIEHGFTHYHRKSFAPVKNMIAQAMA